MLVAVPALRFLEARQVVLTSTLPSSAGTALKAADGDGEMTKPATVHRLPAPRQESARAKSPPIHIFERIASQFQVAPDSNRRFRIVTSIGFLPWLRAARACATLKTHKQAMAPSAIPGRS